jgi:hypothetical protein
MELSRNATLPATSLVPLLRAGARRDGIHDSLFGFFSGFYIDGFVSGSNFRILLNIFCPLTHYFYIILYNYYIIFLLFNNNIVNINYKSHLLN